MQMFHLAGTQLGAFLDHFRQSRQYTNLLAQENFGFSGDNGQPGPIDRNRWHTATVTEDSMRRLLLVLAALFLLLLPAVDGLASDVADLEAESISLVNSERTSAGLSPLAADGAALSVARNWSAKMAQAGGLSHNPNLPNEIDGWIKLGENVGRGPTVKDIHNAFMASPDHTHNILEPAFESIAVGVVVSNGQVWLTQIFILREKSSAAAPAAQAASTPDTPRRARVAGVKIVRAPAPAAPEPVTVVEGATFLESQSQTAMLVDSEATDEGTILALDGIDLGKTRSDTPPLLAVVMLIAVVGAHMFRLSFSVR